MGMITAASIMSVASIGSSIYQSEQQKKIAEENTQKRELAAKNEKDRLAKIERDKRPDEEGVSGEIKFGGDTSGEMGSYGDFLVDKGSNSALGAGGGSGLGSGLGSGSNRTSLGFKV